MTARLSLRARLTAWYAAMLVGGGALLLGAAYLIVRGEIASTPAEVRTAVDENLERAPAPGTDGTARRAPGPAAAVGQLIDAQADANAAAIERSLAGFAIAFAVLVGVALAGGWLVAGHVLRPVRRVTAAAQSISAEHLDRRVGLRGPQDELKQLADAFDAMVDRLAQTFAAQRHFVAGAAHELRTPLAVAAAEIDVATSDPDADARTLREVAQRVREDIDRLERLVARLLTLADAEHGIDATEDLDLAELVREAAAGARAQGPDDVTLRLDLQPTPLRGDPFLLRSLVDNLLENALVHNHPGGEATARASTDGGSAVLEVQSTGPPLCPELIAGLFDPFVSGEPQTRTSGLGLAIVRAVARAHGGDVEARARPGGGLLVRVTLPAAPLPLSRLSPGTPA